MPGAHENQIAFAQDVYEIIRSDHDTSKVTVLSGRCGLGKSALTRALISYFAIGDGYIDRGKNAVGLIVITNTLSGLTQYEKPIYRGTSLEQHSHYLTSIRSDDRRSSIMNQLHRSTYYPIVTLTSQRWADMSPELREMLFKYEYGKKNVRRIVLFDEKPVFDSVVPLTVKHFNDIDTIIYSTITEGYERDYLTKQYRLFSQSIRKLLEKTERQNNDLENNIVRDYWMPSKNPEIKPLPIQFFDLIKKYKSKFMEHDIDIMKRIHHLNDLMVDGAFITINQRQRGTDYGTYFELYKDNIDQFYLDDDSAKFFILDGTSANDPDYKRTYMRIVEFDKYNIQLPLKIYHNNVNTSKSNMLKREDDLIEPIKEAIKKHTDPDNPMLLITYNKVESKFLDMPDVSVEHFGGLSGSNAYRNTKLMSYVGVNRYNEFQYFIKYIGRNPKIFEAFKSQKDFGKYVKCFIQDKMRTNDNGGFYYKDFHDLMIDSLMSEFEQDIFRLAIRDYNNTDDVVVHTYWNHNVMGDLIEKVMNRFESLGVESHILHTPIELDIAKINSRRTSDDTMTIPQKILDWYAKQPRRKTFKLKSMLDELEITSKQFNSAKQNKAIKYLFNDIKTDRKGIYTISK